MKQKIKEEIYHKDFKGNYGDVRFSDLPKTIQENDIIEIRREEAFFSENESYDAYTELVIIREREETDEEYQKRISDLEYHKLTLRKRRYESYLKLKSEFEVEQTILDDNKKSVPHTTISNACPVCGGDIHDGTGTGWEICKDCGWMG